MHVAIERRQSLSGFADLSPRAEDPEAGSGSSSRHPRPSCQGPTGDRSKTVGPAFEPTVQQILGTGPRRTAEGTVPISVLLSRPCPRNG